MAASTRMRARRAAIPGYQLAGTPARVIGRGHASRSCVMAGNVHIAAKAAPGQRAPRYAGSHASVSRLG